MAHENNPQETQMADESMLRTLAAQANAIWPQEKPLIQNYAIPDSARILDVGCGSGEICSRLANLYPHANITGVDLIDSHLHYARKHFSDASPYLQFQSDDAMNLSFANSEFDLCVNRHMLQSVPNAKRVLEEMVRVTRPGGIIHLIPEDYGMIHCSSPMTEVENLFNLGAMGFGDYVKTDLRIGRRAFRLLKSLGVKDIKVNYITVDTSKVDRSVFADIMIAWRDGFASAMHEAGSLNHGTAMSYFNEFIRCIQDENEYAVWQVPVLSAIV